MRAFFPRLGVLLLLAAASSTALALTARELDALPLHVLDTAALDASRARASDAGARPGPTVLAFTAPLTLGLEDGHWSLDGDTAVWRARVLSPGATALIAAFDRFDLPAGAELLVSRPDAHVTHRYQADDRAADGSLWTAMIPGEEALLELRVPQALRDRVDLHLAQLAHGVLPMDRSGAFAKSGSCNIDVACTQANAWRDQVRATVLLQIPSTGLPGGASVSLCTGQLVNTTAQDATPYVLTAHHCGISAAQARNVVAYFNYQTSACGGTPDGRIDQTVTGAARVFTHARSDHTLIRLNSAPAAAFNVHHAGFDASTTSVPLSGAALHHPGGDEKRISLFNAPGRREAVTLTGTAGTTVEAFGVNWTQGVTEQGSSGAGLYDQNRRLVGVLSGGNSSCASPTGRDYFGRLDVAWDAGLGRFLDPVGNGSTRSVCGTQPGSRCTSGGSTPAVPPPVVPPVVSPGAPVDEGGAASSGGGAVGAAGLGLLIAALLRRLTRARPAGRAKPA